MPKQSTAPRSQPAPAVAAVRGPIPRAAAFLSSGGLDLTGLVAGLDVAPAERTADVTGVGAMAVGAPAAVRRASTSASGRSIGRGSEVPASRLIDLATVSARYDLGPEQLALVTRI